ncbi:MAG: DNA polymerase [Patescibacteria group bacterium]
MWSHLKEQGIELPKITSKEINEQIGPVLRRMEKIGVEIDVKSLNSLAKDTEGKLRKIEKQIWKLAGEEFNINSPMQMAEILYKKFKLLNGEIKKTKNGYSTAANELKKLEGKHKIIKPILEYRELSKLLSTYLKPLPLLVDEKSRLHTSYGQDTTTGRLTSNEPNLQNIPIKGELGQKIRKAFVASKGMKLISADYSQIELRVVACLANDKVMKEAFIQHQDIHAKTAAEIFDTKTNKVTSDQRRVAKTVNFGVLYGMSPYGLSQSLSIEQEKAADFISRYFTAHSGIKDYCNRMIGKAHDEGYVETIFGFKRMLPNIDSHYRNIANAEERMAINTPVQGSAAEILKLAMIDLEKKLDDLNKNKFKAQMLLTIHDELIIEVVDSAVSEVAKIVKETMEQVIKLCVPIVAEVKVGNNWGEMKVLKI